MERLQGGYSWEGTLSSYRGCQRVILGSTDFLVSISLILLSINESH